MSRNTGDGDVNEERGQSSQVHPEGEGARIDELSRDNHHTHGDANNPDTTRIALSLASELLRNSQATWETLRFVDYWRHFTRSIEFLQNHVQEATPTQVFSRIALGDARRSLVGLLVFMGQLDRDSHADSWTSRIGDPDFEDRATLRLRCFFKHRNIGRDDQIRDCLTALHTIYLWLLNPIPADSLSPNSLRREFLDAIETVISFSGHIEGLMPTLADKRIYNTRRVVEGFLPRPNDYHTDQPTTTNLAILWPRLKLLLPHYADITPTIWPSESSTETYHAKNSD